MSPIPPQRSDPRIARLAAWLERWLVAAVLVPAVVGLTVPAVGRWADRHDGIDITLAVLVVASGLAIPAGAGRTLRAVGGRLTLVVLASSALLPLIALGVAQLLPPGASHDGVLAIGVAPAEVASVGLSGLAGGEVAVAAALLGASMLVSVAVAGPVLSAMAGDGVAPGHVVVQLVVVVGLPLLVGLAGRGAVRGTDEASGVAGRRTVRGTDEVSGVGPLTGTAAPIRRSRPPVPAEVPGLVATVSVLVLVGLVASQIHPAVAYLRVTAALVVLVGASALVSIPLARSLPVAAARSVRLHVSMRDFAVASGIATAAFGSAATGPLGIYGVLVIAWGTVVARSNRRATRAVP